MTVNWINKEFLTKVAETLHDIGFVTNEHIFTPYGRTISENVSLIQENLENKKEKVGFLKSGKMQSVYGTIYYIFDSDKFPNEEAENAILYWIRNQYNFDSEE